MGSWQIMGRWRRDTESGPAEEELTGSQQYRRFGTSQNLSSGFAAWNRDDRSVDGRNKNGMKQAVDTARNPVFL